MAHLGFAITDGSGFRKKPSWEVPRGEGSECMVDRSRDLYTNGLAPICSVSAHRVEVLTPAALVARSLS